MSIVKNSLNVGIITLISRLMGYVRDVMIASKLGAGIYSDAFFVAFRLPNMFRTMFAEGAFSASFIPMFSKIKEHTAAQDFATNVFSIMFYALSLFTIFAQIFMPVMVWMLASGFEANPEKFALSTALTRITFFYLTLISLSSICAGILNSMHKFIIAAVAPILLNITFIVALLFFSGSKEASAYSLSWAVFAAGVLQFVWLYYSCAKSGFLIIPTRPKLDADTRKLFRRMVPVLIGAGVLQINVLVDTQIASHISEGAVSFLYYADRVSQLPLALIGTAMGVVLLPSLSKFLRDGNHELSITTQNHAVWVTMFLAIPAAIGLGMLSYEITNVLFQRGNFSANDTEMVAKALHAFAFGTPAFILAKVFTPSFYAAEDTKTPVKIAVLCIALNVIVSLTLIFGFGFDHVALAIATVTSSWTNVVLLNWFLHKKGLFKFNKMALIKLAQIAFCAGLMAAVIIALQALDISANPTLDLFVTIAGAGAVYFAAALLLKTISIKAMLSRV